MALQLSLNQTLFEVLESLLRNPHPNVPNPPDCTKRASVALILRIRPDYADGVAFAKDLAKDLAQAGQAPPSQPHTLAGFFEQQWVQTGEPEILFIKRTGRAGDRWSGHTALPGGGRDPIDVDDHATAVRETLEEVGLDLSRSASIYSGKLPERLITTTLMVLCPFLFVLTDPQSPSLIPQPTEVAATHWVPLRALLSPSLRTNEHVEVSSRLGRQSGPLTKTLLRLLLGKMVFSAIRLVPSESVFAPAASHLCLGQQVDTAGSSLAAGSSWEPSSAAQSGPLLLWGITLGIIADLIDKLPPHNAIELWSYPTFTPPDLKMLIYLFTYHLRKNNARFLNAGSWSGQPAVDATTISVAASGSEPPLKPDAGKLDSPQDRDRSPEATRLMLAGYFERVNVAIATFLVVRTAAAGGLILLAFRVLKNRQ